MPGERQSAAAAAAAVWFLPCREAQMTLIQHCLSPRCVFFKNATKGDASESSLSTFLPHSPAFFIFLSCFLLFLIPPSTPPPPPPWYYVLHIYKLSSSCVAGTREKEKKKRVAFK